ncbi:hypothetical protein OF83DRAFT_1084907 [Amylostereum chailletii]|nr:hypothetical protein OF83DRAFT_1084907 [Amylostereum chailletii]
MSHTTDAYFKKQTQTVGRPPVTSHDINEEYMRNPPNNLGTASLEQAADAIRRDEAAEDALNEEKRSRDYRAETKKHTGGRLGALDDAEIGGVPDQREATEGTGVLDNAGGKPVRHDVETSLLE